MSPSSRTPIIVASPHGRAVMCADASDGHVLHPLRRRLAQATPTHWQDALVADIGTDGVVVLRALADPERTMRVWHHHPLDDVLVRGMPVAWHARYRVLAVGPLRLSVRLLG